MHSKLIFLRFFWLRTKSYWRCSVSLFSKACYTSKTETEISRFVIAEGRMILSRFLAADISNVSSTLPVNNIELWWRHWFYGFVNPVHCGSNTCIRAVDTIVMWCFHLFYRRFYFIFNCFGGLSRLTRLELPFLSISTTYYSSDNHFQTYQA